jgi:uncharacterized protein YyaL (SSP411 family)
MIVPPLARLLGVVACALTVVSGAAAARGSGDRGVYLREAKAGLQTIDHLWWNTQAQWYTTYPYDPAWGPGGLATLWDVAPVFATAALIARADPSAENTRELRKVAMGAERYWDPDVKPNGAYTISPGTRGNVNAFFDDDGWWGLDFFDAYRVTRDRRFLTDAVRAFRFIIAAGWATRSGGGVWWDTAHEKKTAEPLAAAALLGAELYETTHVAFYLRQSRKLIGWADAHSWNAGRRLYQRSDVSDTVMNYVQGMMIAAHAVLCRALRQQSYCRKAEQLAAASQEAFPPTYRWAPETDAIYLRWLLELWAVDHDARWYQVADDAAQRALANARDDRGIYSKNWDGTYASDDRILTSAGTLMLFAALAVSPAPSGE